MTPAQWKSIIYFKSEEFDSPDQRGSGENMDYELISLLDSLRTYVGVPLEISSGFRTESYNRKIGGVPGSAHTEGKAADISCFTSTLRYKIIRFAIINNIRRIEICDQHIHIDISKKLPQDVAIWARSK